MNSIYPSTVHILSDSEEYRSSLSSLVRRLGCRIVEYSSVDSAIQSLKSQESSHFDSCCILLDVDMSKMDSIEDEQLIVLHGFSIPIVYMTEFANVEMVITAMNRGATTLLEKPVNSTKLNEAVELALCACRSWYTHHLTMSTNKQEYNEFQRRLKWLTPREREVYLGIVEGHSNKLIANELGISVRTVEVHRSRVMKKLNAKSVSSLIRLAVVNGIAA